MADRETQQPKKDAALQAKKNKQKPLQPLQGMMWAEIFGPPRAKKPYRRIY
jgi:methionine salvage enolase-phosphatase E1